MRDKRINGLGYRPLGWLEPEELSTSLGVEGSLDHADVEGGVFEDGRPFPLAGEPLHRSAFVSAQGSVFGYVARKNDLGVGSPGVASPVTGDTSSGEESRLRGAGLLAGFPQHLQAAPGDEVVFVPPGVSRTLVPLDCALVLQILYGVVVALTVRSDTGALRRFEKGEVGSW